MDSTQLSAYIPFDRRRVLARGTILPEYSRGSALFADVSGFTALTEGLTRTLGTRRGSEELTQHMNQVYDALIREINAFGGSVIGFSGDAVTCWFDPNTDSPDPVEVRAAACGLAIQEVMQQFESIRLSNGEVITLAIKSAIASGAVRRFLVGDPSIQLIEALAGDTITRMAQGEDLAERGETLVDAPTFEAADDLLKVAEWRTDPVTKARFALISAVQSQPARTPPTQHYDLTEEQMRPWVLPPVYQRLRQGMGEFLTELRPAVALFLRFTGIDYENDSAADQKLGSFIQHVQRVLETYEGVLLQLTIGEKGSFIYAAFGAPLAHEDDADRAVSAALQLFNLRGELDFLENIQIGISHGVMRTGSYGGTTRRTYGVLGDNVNLAARLMQYAAQNEIWGSESILTATARNFIWEDLPPIQVKGKRDLIPVARLVDARRESRRFNVQQFALPMVGREKELELIVDRLKQAINGHGQVVGITSEAGMGKSRLVTEAMNAAAGFGIPTLDGECLSFGTNSAYLAWQPLWRSFFGLEENETPEALQASLQALDPGLADKMPLLSSILNMDIPDNAQTYDLEPQQRKKHREALLIDCLRAYTQKNGRLMLVLEDIHWIDPLSDDLLKTIASAAADLPILLLMAYRPPGQPHLESLPHFTFIELAELTAPQAEQIIRGKLGQFNGRQALQMLIARIIERSQGNPFYIEELVNYLQDRGIDLNNVEVLEEIELPNSLHSLILSRIDRLSERQNMLIKVASIVGRVVPMGWLQGYYPELGERKQVKQDLEGLTLYDLLVLDTPEPQLAYLFKHIVIQEVAYQSLPYAMRTQLHERFAQFLETTRARLDLIAYHYDHSKNQEKRREYLRRAGEHALATGAYQEAVFFLTKAADLENDFASRASLEQQLGEAYWNLDQIEQGNQHNEQALVLLGKVRQSAFLELSAQEKTICQQLDTRHAPLSSGEDWISLARGLYATGKGDWKAAADFLSAASSGQHRDESMAALATVYYHQARYSEALELYSELSQSDKPMPRNSGFNGRGYCALRLGQLDAAEQDALHQTDEASALLKRLNRSLFAQIHLRRGQLEQAGEFMAQKEMLALLSFGLLEVYRGAVEFCLARWERSGEPEHRKLTRDALKYLHQYAQIFDIGRPSAWAYQSAYDWLNGNPDRAKDAAQESIREARQLGMPYEQGLAHFWRGRVTQSPADLQTAQELFQQIGAAWDAERTKQFMG